MGLYSWGREREERRNSSQKERPVRASGMMPARCRNTESLACCLTHAAGGITMCYEPELGFPWVAGAQNVRQRR